MAVLLVAAAVWYAVSHGAPSPLSTDQRLVQAVPKEWKQIDQHTFVSPDFVAATSTRGGGYNDNPVYAGYQAVIDARQEPLSTAPPAARPYAEDVLSKAKTCSNCSDPELILIGADPAAEITTNFDDHGGGFAITGRSGRDTYYISFFYPGTAAEASSTLYSFLGAVKLSP